MPSETPRVQEARLEAIRNNLAARGLPGGPLVRAPVCVCVRVCVFAFLLFVSLDFLVTFVLRACLAFRLFSSFARCRRFGTHK